MPDVTLRSSASQGPLRVQLYGIDGTPALKTPELLSSSRGSAYIVVDKAGAYTAVATRPSGETLTVPVEITPTGTTVDFAPDGAPGSFLSSAMSRGLLSDVTSRSNDILGSLMEQTRGIQNKLAGQTGALAGEGTNFLSLAGPAANVFRAISSARSLPGPSMATSSGTPDPSLGLAPMNPFWWWANLTGAMLSPLSNFLGASSPTVGAPTPTRPSRQACSLYAWSITRDGMTPAPKDFEIRTSPGFLQIAVGYSPGAPVRAFGLLDESGFGPIVIAPPFVDGFAITFLSQGVAASDSAERVDNPSAIRVPVALATPNQAALADLLTTVSAAMFPDAGKLWTEETRQFGERSEDALNALSEKFQDHAAAVLGALFLARFKPEEAPLHWLRNLDNLLEAPVADAKILLARRLMRGGEEDAPAAATEIRDLLQAAAARPVCYFAGNRSFLTQALRLYGIPVNAPAPGDFLDVAADAGGLEAFWGTSPFAPRHHGSAPGEPTLRFWLDGEVFRYSDPGA